MLNSSTPSECVPVFESSECKTFDRLSRCRECKDAARLPVMFKDASGRFHVQCVEHSFGGRLESLGGLFGLADSSSPAERSLAIYEEACAAQADRYLSVAPAAAPGLKLLADDGGRSPLTADALSPESFFSFYCLRLELSEHCTALGPHGFCASCADSFALSASSLRCVQGAINHCRVYAGESKCSECEEGFLVALSDSACLPRVAENCLTTKPDADECLACREGFWMEAPAPGAAPGQTCRPYSAADCLEFDPAADRCLSCKGDDQFFGRYLDAADGRCKEHRAVDHCAEYLRGADGCGQCRPGYYVDPRDARRCSKDPHGIEHCAVYQDATTCRFCAAGFFLEANACRAVETAIDRCLYYRSASVCAQCSAGSVPVAGRAGQAPSGEPGSPVTFRVRAGAGAVVLGLGRRAELLFVRRGPAASPRGVRRRDPPSLPRPGLGARVLRGAGARGVERAGALRVRRVPARVLPGGPLLHAPARGV